MWDTLDDAIEDVILMTNGDIDDFFKDKKTETVFSNNDNKEDKELKKIIEEAKKDKIDEKVSKSDFKDFLSS